MSDRKFHKDKFKHLDALRKLELNIGRAYCRRIYGDDDGFFHAFVKEILDQKEREQRHATSPVNPKSELFFPFESPDMYFLYGDTIVGIEHFQFDSYKSSKGKGSAGIRDEFMTGKEIEEKYKELRQQGKRETVQLSRRLSTPMSYDDYRANLVNGFNSHYERISEYKSNLRAAAPQTQEVKICFYIEDATPLGNYYASKNERLPLEPLFVKEFAEALMNANELDYVIYSLKDHNYLTQLYFFHNTAGNRASPTEFYDDGLDFVAYDFVKHTSIFSCADDR